MLMLLAMSISLLMFDEEERIILDIKKALTSICDSEQSPLLSSPLMRDKSAHSVLFEACSRCMLEASRPLPQLFRGGDSSAESQPVLSTEDLSASERIHTKGRSCHYHSAPKYFQHT